MRRSSGSKSSIWFAPVATRLISLARSSRLARRSGTGLPRNRLAEADRREGRCEAQPLPAATTLTAAEREALLRLRRENKQPRLARDILPRAAAWFARETGLHGSPAQC